MGLLGLLRQAICPESSVRLRGFLLLASVLMLCACHHGTMAESSACASGCMNGGQMLLPNNIFGFCRCRCREPFLGPRCQFTKRGRSGVNEKRFDGSNGTEVEDQRRLVEGHVADSVVGAMGETSETGELCWWRRLKHVSISWTIAVSTWSTASVSLFAEW